MKKTLPEIQDVSEGDSRFKIYNKRKFFQIIHCINT